MDEFHDPSPLRLRNVQAVGRLDQDTTGLLILTDDGALIHRLTSPKHKVPKVYRATVDADLTPDLIGLFAAGTLQLEGEKEPCAPAELRIVSPREAELTRADLDGFPKRRAVHGHQSSRYS